VRNVRRDQAAWGFVLNSSCCFELNPPVLQGSAATNAPLDGEASPSHITFCFGEVVPPPTKPFE
jgi:hypothetical protein